MVDLFTWAASALALAGTGFVLLLTLRRLVLARQERERLEAEDRLRPLALALLEGETPEVAGLEPRDLHVLTALLARYARWVRGHARDHVAGFFESRGEVERELAHLRNRRAWRRATAAFALGDMGSAAAVPALLETLDDHDRDVRGAAARSLGRLGAVAAVQPLAIALGTGSIPRAVAGQALLTIGPAALDGLELLLGHEEAEVRACAVELIGLLGDASDASLLAARLRDTSAEVRAKASRALGRLGAEDAAAELRATLADRIPFVRTAAATALGAIGDREAVPDLLGQAAWDEFYPARAAAHAVARVDPAAAAAAAEAENAPHVCEAVDLLEVRRT
jgi:HEAT repeat protein